LQVSSINRVLRNISSELSGKPMSDNAAATAGMYDRFGLFAAAAAANAWNRGTSPWYGGGAACSAGPGAPQRPDYHHRTSAGAGGHHHHSPIPAASSQMLAAKKGQYSVGWRRGVVVSGVRHERS